MKKNSPLLNKYTLTGNSEISPDVHLIKFRRDFGFLPGQAVKIALDNEIPPRIYSLCSGSNDKEAAILFNVKNEGLLTPRLAALVPGDEILVSPPYGSFTNTDEAAWWIATGTGIAPFYSMLRSGLHSDKILIHGVSYLNQFYFSEELKEALGEDYIRCCSREFSSDIFHGRVTDYLLEIKNFPPVKYFLCGNAFMVVEVRDLLISKGIPFENIFAEIYF